MLILVLELKFQNKKLENKKFFDQETIIGTNEQGLDFEQMSKKQFLIKWTSDNFLAKKMFKVWPKQNISAFLPNFSNFHPNCKFLDEKNFRNRKWRLGKSFNCFRCKGTHRELSFKYLEYSLCHFNSLLRKRFKESLW